MRLLPLLALPLLVACEDGGDINLLSLQDDMDLGAELAAEIEADPETYPLLDPQDYPEAYAYLEDMRDDILATSDIRYGERFDWPMHIIDDDEVLNAFAAPGGYIYVYTGLMRYLDEEDHLAGVLGHEIAHADQRHSTQQLTKQYGVAALVSLIFGKNPGLAVEIAQGLTSLQFSRTDEAEADEYSVYYLCETVWAADGAAGFFEKLESEGGGIAPPEFLSTHPSSASRIEDIRARAEQLGCETKLYKDAAYADFLETLP